MITLIEALGYRCLRYVSQPLDDFHVLVGPNASGKTTFLDVVGFLGDLVAEGPEAAVRERTQNFRDLVWNRQRGHFELAVEARLPKSICRKLGASAYTHIRYETAIGENTPGNEISILSERVFLTRRHSTPPVQKSFFPLLTQPPASVLTPSKSSGAKTVVNKKSEGNDYFYPELGKGQGGWITPFRLGSGRSALANLPEDETKFPAATWLKRLLAENVQPFVLNSLLMRRASPPGQAKGFKPDGSNLPWIVAALERDHSDRHAQWTDHVRTALPDLKGITTRERTDDRHRYLLLKFESGLEIPSWMASDGTLRLLALTLPAYLPEFEGVYLIEEPENGIHPKVVETVMQALSSVYGAQMLLASHSPVVLSVVEPEQVLCFAKTAEGATDIVTGDKHPSLRDWRRQENLGVLFAAGVLG
jgi:predicted ATPase